MGVRLDMYKQRFQDEIRKFKESKRGFADAVNLVLMLVIIGVIGWIGVLIMHEVKEATDLPTSGTFADMSTAITDAVSTGYSLVAIIIIVAIATVILTYLFGFMPRGGGR